MMNPTRDEVAVIAQPFGNLARRIQPHTNTTGATTKPSPISTMKNASTVRVIIKDLADRFLAEPPRY
jgi:hypothetical protein